MIWNKRLNLFQISSFKHKKGIKKYQLNFRILEKRAAIIRAVRNFFLMNGFLEVETPLRIPAPVPEANIDLFESEKWYLQSSPEICMKRLAAHGFGKIFQICKCFRKDERSDRHLTELTMLEWYTKGYTYLNLMDQCQKLIQYIASEIYHGKKKEKEKKRKKGGGSESEVTSESSICYNGKVIDLSGPWHKITVEQAFSQYASVSMEQALFHDEFDCIMGFEIEPNLGMQTPSFIFDYPNSLAALAKLRSDDKKIAERFELYISGIELANGFSELTDSVEQKKRFEKELEIRKKAGKNITPMPEQFLNDLKFLPETAGIALGVDRLVMLFTDSASIDDVVAFIPEKL